MKCRYFCRLPLDISPVYLTRGISSPMILSLPLLEIRTLKHIPVALSMRGRNHNYASFLKAKMSLGVQSRILQSFSIVRTVTF